MDPKALVPYDVKLMPLADLKDHPANPRTIRDTALKGLLASIERFGLIEPIIWNRRTGFIVGGHQRKKALEAGGYTEAQVLVVDFDPDQEMMANLSLNNPHIQGQFTDETADLLIHFEDFAPDAMRELGLDDLMSDMAARVKRTGKTAEDEIPPIPPTARAKKGEIWILGDHRLACGDSTANGDLWKRLFADRPSAAAVFTDPPYGVDYQDQGGKYARIRGDEKKGDDLAGKLLVPAFMKAKAHSEKTAAWYIWHASSTREDFAWAMKAAGLIERQYLIWAKPQIVLGWADYGWSHEPCFYAARAGETPQFHGERGQATVWRATLVKHNQKAMTLQPGVLIRDGQGGQIYVTGKPPRDKKVRSVRLSDQETLMLSGGGSQADLWEVARDIGTEHPTQKPVELARRAIENSTLPGQIVLDPFLGSGTTLIGAEVCGRACFGFELEPTYCDVIIRRWEAFAGKTAVRSSDI